MDYNIVIPHSHNPELVHMMLMRSSKVKRNRKGGCYKRAVLMGRYVLKTERGTVGSGEALQEIALHVSGLAQGVVAPLLAWHISITPDEEYPNYMAYEVQMVMPRLILPQVLRKRARFYETEEREFQKHLFDYESPSYRLKKDREWDQQHAPYSATHNIGITPKYMGGVRRTMAYDYGANHHIEDVMYRHGQLYAKRRESSYES